MNRSQELAISLLSKEYKGKYGILYHQDTKPVILKIRKVVNHFSWPKQEVLQCMFSKIAYNPHKLIVNLKYSGNVDIKNISDSLEDLKMYIMLGV